MLLSSQNLSVLSSQAKIDRDGEPDNLIERALGEVNGFGKFQIRTIMLLGIPALSTMSLWVMTVFWGQVPAHECVNGTAIVTPCQNQGW